MEETFQNAEFDTLLAYDSSEDFSDTDRRVINLPFLYHCLNEKIRHMGFFFLNSISDDVCNENIVEEVENTDKSDISELYVGKTKDVIRN
ncbi:unnamed protein product [Rhizophagus irregularis]|nr:unnamed protein product [Rhizophagus irregularis]CAB5382747.1 unnamed protein product [Rhizophagus irregularis]